MMKSQQQVLPLEPTANTTSPIVLEVRGGIPSFKNSKMLIAKTPHGKPLDRPLLITKPEFQKRMQEIVDSFASQLLCAFRTSDGQTLTGSSLQSAIASSVPEDDAWTQIPDITIRGELCALGSEGATIIIEKLT